MSEERIKELETKLNTVLENAVNLLTSECTKHESVTFEQFQEVCGDHCQYCDALRLKELEKLIADHNNECEETCKLWRDNKTCSHYWYKRQCPNCPKDWMIEQR